MTELALDPNTKGEANAFGVEAAYWFTSQLNVSLRYFKEHEGKARLQDDWNALNFIWAPVPLFKVVNAFSDQTGCVGADSAARDAKR